MSVKRLTWLEEILERAEKSLKEDKASMAKTRVGMALAITRELLKRAKEHQKRDLEKKAHH
jgi:DNA recombination-dependent growth factor C